jgi:hypothetical protein
MSLGLIPSVSYILPPPKCPNFGNCVKSVENWKLASILISNFLFEDDFLKISTIWHHIAAP